MHACVHVICDPLSVLEDEGREGGGERLYGDTLSHPAFQNMKSQLCILHYSQEEICQPRLGSLVIKQVAIFLKGALPGAAQQRLGKCPPAYF